MSDSADVLVRAHLVLWSLYRQSWYGANSTEKSELLARRHVESNRVAIGVNRELYFVSVAKRIYPLGVALY